MKASAEIDNQMFADLGLGSLDGKDRTHEDMAVVLSPEKAGSVATSLRGRHILSVDMFSKDQLYGLFNLAQQYTLSVHKGKPLRDILQGKVMTSVFYEVSASPIYSRSLSHDPSNYEF